MNRDNQNPDKPYGSQALDSDAGPFENDNARRAATTPASPLDDEEILPLLEEVIQLQDSVKGVWDKAQSGTQPGLSPRARYPGQPGTDFERDLLAYKLKTHFSDGLEQIVRSAVSAAVERSVRDLEMTLHDELIESLESRLDEMVSSLLGDQSPIPQPGAPDEQSG
jgi:hypothetical protein